MVELTIDPTVNAARVRVAEGRYAYTDDVSPGRFYTRGVDYSAEGQVLAYEFLNIDRGVDLSGLPHRDELARIFAEHHIRVLETT